MLSMDIMTAKLRNKIGLPAEMSPHGKWAARSFCDSTENQDLTLPQPAPLQLVFKAGKLPIEMCRQVDVLQADVLQRMLLKSMPVWSPLRS